MDDPPYILQAARKVRQTRHLSRASLYLERWFAASICGLRTIQREEGKGSNDERKKNGY